MGRASSGVTASSPLAWAPRAVVLTALHHAHFVTLAQPAGLTALSPVLVDGALVCSWTHVVIVS